IAFVRSNHTLTLSMLIEGMMLPSGNDAAHVVAAAVARYVTGNDKMKGEDAVDYFVTMMNEYATSIGCTGTHCIVPDGYAHENHYFSAHDLVVIGKLALANEIIAKYASTPSEKVFYASGHTMTWHNTNQLIHPESDFYSPYVTGLKTGSLAENYCVFVSSAIGGKTYLIGLFKAPEEAGRYEDAHKVINALLALTE
ncbi:MAG: D-alanyl-D-alanine carboxypeptidase, partial [Clostridia bacterium]|nr:D-alanyl-D-alanine carboxypeptidase [Clostridia bacterium]